MKVYIDLLFLFNFFIDFLLLITVSITLKRGVTLFKAILGAFFGSISLLALFIPFNSFFLFLFKIGVGLIMCIITFRYKDAKYTLTNFSYLFMTGVILGGFLYYLENELTLKSMGLVFLKKELPIPYLFLVLISPIILYVFFKQNKKIKELQSYVFDVEIQIEKEIYKLKGYLDTANTLQDPITGKSVILIEKKILKKEPQKFFFIPYKVLNHNSILKVIKPEYIMINSICSKKYLIGLSKEAFHIEGVECLLHKDCGKDFL